MTTRIASKNSEKDYPAKKYYNALTNFPMSDKNYEHALKVWKAVNILLLACVFETFRKEFP